MTCNDRLNDDIDQHDDKPTPQFEELYGLLKEAFQSLGGGEAYLRGERTQFHSPSGVEK